MNAKTEVKLTAEQMLVVNQLSTLRRELRSYNHGVSSDGKRSLYDIFKFPEELQFEELYSLFRRNGFANRVVAGISDRCWKAGFTLEVDDEQILEDELKLLFNDRRMLAQTGKADVLNRIGNYSILYVGIPGQKPEEPLQPVSSGDLSKVYFSPFAEDGIDIVERETDPTNERFGLPTMYQVNVVSRGDEEEQVNTMSRKVHWSRVVHLAEGSLDNPVEGVSALSPVYNAIYSIEKTNYSAAEAYFRNARGKIALEVDKDFKGILDDTVREKMKDELEAFQNEWNDFMRLSGTEAKVLNTPQHDPKGTFDVNIAEVSSATGIPVRILTGEGSGQYAGNEDKAAYNAVIYDRQNSFCVPVVTRLLEILSEANLLDIPEEAKIVFPISSALNETEEADIILKKSQALQNTAQAIGVGAPLFGEVTFQQWIEDVFGMDYDPDSIVDEIIDEQGRDVRQMAAELTDEDVGDEDPEDQSEQDAQE